MDNHAVLIVAHGSKVKETNSTMEMYTEALKRKAPETQFEKAYLQLMTPSVETAIDALYEKGIRELTVFPFFLFQGNHILEDIPAVLSQLKLKYSDLKIEFLNNIGYDEALVELILRRAALI